ncbi:MAG: hypothetical protein QNJ38_17295 [Prochloraceae cyanobacterium]|nr:hypothetical protein [Prochloraceae cyanobacterium]
MSIELTKAEIEEIKELLKDYDPGRKAIAVLEENNGSIEASFNELWQEKNGTQTLGNGKFWKVTKKVLRQEICGDEGFRNKVKEYNKNRSAANAAPLLIGAIVHVVN